MEMGAFIFLMVRIVFPVVNAVVFLELFIKERKNIFFWVFIIFICLFVGNSLWLVAVLFPEYTYLGILGYQFSAPVSVLKDGCTLVRFFAYYKFGNILIGKIMSRTEKLIWGILFALIMTTVFIKDDRMNYIRYYGVPVTYTAIIWVILISGVLNIIKNQCKFSKMDFNALVFIYCSTLFCYFFSYILLIVNGIGMVSINGGGFIVAANLNLCITGIGWAIYKAYRSNDFQHEAKTELEKLTEDILSVSFTERSPQYTTLNNLQIKYELTDRETEILGLMLDGKTNEEIAKILFIALGTVKSHTHNIFNKMDITRRSQLISMVDIYNLKHRGMNAT